MRILASYFNHYRDFSLALWLNIVAVFVNAAGVMMSFFVALYLVNVEHFSVMQMAWVFAIGGVGGIVGSYIGGWCADRFNHVRICQISLLFVALQNVLIPFTHVYGVIMLLIFLSNLFTFIFRPSNSLILFAHCEQSDRTRVFAFYRMAYNLGLAFAIAIGGALARINFDYFFWFTALMSVLSAGLLHYWFKILNSKSIRREHKPDQSAWGLLLCNRAFLILLLLFVLNYLIFCQMRAMYGLYLAHYDGLNVQVMGYVFTINMALIVLLEVPLMSWLKVAEPIHLVVLGTLFVGAGFAILPFGSNIAVPILSMILLTLGEIFTASPFYVLAMRYADKSCPGFFMGIFQGGMTTGIVLAPLVGGLIYPYFEGRILWFGCGVLSLLMMFGFRRLIKLQQEQVYEK